jgi:hypothetical protein
MDIIVCSQCGNGMARFEMVFENGVQVEKDWTNDIPVCPVCRGVPGAKPLVRKRDVLGGFAWKRDKDGKKVPK